MAGKRRIDRITSDSYLEGLSTKPMPDVRSLRDECLEEETVLSFERRLLHARVDILKAELERRSGVGGSLIERLASILADERPPSRHGAYPGKDPVLDIDRSKRRIEKLVSDDTLANLAGLSVEGIEGIIATLQEAAGEVSESRGTVQQVLDAVNAEIGRRYKSGEVDPDDALAL